MAHEDWRLRIELGEGETGGLLGSLGVLSLEARALVSHLKAERFAVTKDGNRIYVYVGSSEELDSAEKAIGVELGELAIAPVDVVREHWLADAERWDDDPAEPSIESETLARGVAPWEVRIPCGSHAAAHALADQLERAGYGVVRRWRYVIAGVASREEAESVAARFHGDAEPGGELVWESVPDNPFALFGGLAG